MTVRGRILALQVACAVWGVSLIALVAAGLWTAEYSARRMAGITNRLDVLTQLVGDTGNYAAKVAEVLLMGRNKVSELDAARIEVERLLANLTQVTRSEISDLASMTEIEVELPQIETSRRILEVFHGIDASVKRTLSLQRAGEAAAALELFRVQVSFRTTNELGPLLDAAVADERKEIEAQIDILRTRETLFAGIGGVLALIGIAGLVLLPLALRRAVLVPLEALTGRLRILAAGGADRPEAATGGGEFAALSASITELAASIGAERVRSSAAGEKLSSEVDRRTGELQAANTRLREIDRRRGQFLADVSHELRTPLTVLRGEADVALRGTSDAPQLRQSLERIRSEAIDLGKLLEDLIEYARSEAEDQPYQMADTRLDDIIAAAAQEADVLAEPIEASVALALDDGGCHLTVDFRRLKQALLIGLDNAIKHSPPGGRIEIRSARVDGDVAIRILDEGPGVAAADLPHVFERFFRGRSEGDALVDGVGIGLAIAKEIVERHGGRISLSNRAEGGAVLEIILPADRQTSP